MATKKEQEQPVDVEPEDEVLEGQPAEEAQVQNEKAAVEVEEEEAFVEETDEDDEEEEDFEDEDEEDDLDDTEYQVKLKPELDQSTAQSLALRRKQQAQRPAFKRQEWHRYQRLGTKWRRPKGIHSKQRRGFKYRAPTAKVGYGSHTPARGLHPSGFEEVLIHNVDQLEELDPKRQAIRIGAKVGLRKREAIQEQAEELELRVLNPTTKRLRYRQLELALKRGDL